MIIVFVGIAGSGKDTQVEFFEERISMSDLLKARVKKIHDDVSALITKHMDAHEYVPDDISTQVFLQAEQDLFHRGIFSYVSNGFPRTYPQFQWFLRHAERRGQPIAIIHLDAFYGGRSDEEASPILIERMMNRPTRPMTVPECIRRCEVFKEETLPLLAAAKIEAERSPSVRYVEIDALAPKDLVRGQIVKFLDNVQSKAISA